MNYALNEPLAKELEGTYKHKSPYHKNKQLPFIVTGRVYREEFPIECIVVEYRGWKRNTFTTGYKYADVKKMIDSGFLKKAA